MSRLRTIVSVAMCGVPMTSAASTAAQPTPSTSSSPSVVVTPPSRPMPVGWGPHGKKLYYFMVFSNAAPGQDEEFNRWYDRIHAPIMIERGDFISAQRFMVSPAQFAGSNEELKKRRYMVLFALETNDIDAAIKDADVRLHSARNVASRALDYQSLSSITYEALGPITSQKDARHILAEETAAGHVPRPGDPPLRGSFNPFVGSSRVPHASDVEQTPMAPGAPNAARR